jgi:hypothetical protein
MSGLCIVNHAFAALTFIVQAKIHYLNIHVRLSSLLCIILILKKCSKYFDPINGNLKTRKQQLQSESINIIHHKICA